MPTFSDIVLNFPFGKHKGKDIKLVPDSYLTWVLENCNNLDNELRNIIKTELNKRCREGIIVDDERNLDGKIYYGNKFYDAISDDLPF